MTEFNHDFEYVQHLTVGAIGEPSQRVFYIQARQGKQRISLVAEKEQVQALAAAINQLLSDLAERNPLLATSEDTPNMGDMSLEEPLEAEFHVAQIGLGYDMEHDVMVLIIQGVVDFIDEDDNDVMLVRIMATRAQMRALSNRAQEVVAAGRPICTSCGRPIDPEGHFCPERNGHGPGHHHSSD